MTAENFEKNYDVFNSFLVSNAEYDGYIELPVIKTSNLIPHKVIPFSKAISKTWNDFDYWVIFYEHDRFFERLWNNPKKYISKLKKFKGVISPETILVYGRAPDDIFKPYKDMGIKVIAFESEFSKSRKQVTA